MEQNESMFKKEIFNVTAAAVLVRLTDNTFHELLIEQDIMKSQIEKILEFCRWSSGKILISPNVFYVHSGFKPLVWEQLPGYIWLADGPYFAFQIDFCEDGWSESDDNYMYMAQRNDADEPDCEYFLTLDEAKAHCEKLYHEDMDRFVRFLC